MVTALWIAALCLPYLLLIKNAGGILDVCLDDLRRVDLEANPETSRYVWAPSANGPTITNVEKLALFTGEFSYP